MAKKNILVVHNYYQIPGGEDTVVANEVKMLRDHNHKVVLYSRNNSELNTMGKMRKVLLPFSTVFNYRTYREVVDIIKKEKIDIVHVHNTLNLISAAVYYAAKKCKVPVVQTIHNFRLLCPGATFYRDGHICEDCVTKGLTCAIKHKCYRESRLQTIACVFSTVVHRITGIYGKINYICLTDFNKEKLLESKHISDGQVFIKPNFVEHIGKCVPECNRDNYFIFVGRLDKLKGIDLLLTAWKRLGAKAPHLIVCGTGPLETWCKTYVCQNKLNVDMRGYVPNEDARRLIAQSKGLILPTQWYEGFPMSIVEAYSVGTPVICSDLGNAGSIVVNGVSGIKFEHDSISGLIEALHRCDNLTETTIAMYNERYTPEINYKMLLNIYESI